MLDKVGDFTIIAMPTLSGLYECKVYKGRDQRTRNRGERMFPNGYPTFLAKSMSEAKMKVRKLYGCDTQSKLEDF